MVSLSNHALQKPKSLPELTERGNRSLDACAFDGAPLMMPCVPAPAKDFNPWPLPTRSGGSTTPGFGMFIHWGLYSALARHEWTMYQEEIPNEEYARLADRFSAARYSPDDWVALAQDTGMRYMILTSRHHEGFALWDSKVSDFTAPNSAAGRDVLAEFVAACQKRRMPYGFYYSLLDWRWPEILPRATGRP